MVCTMQMLQHNAETIKKKNEIYSRITILSNYLLEEILFIHIDWFYIAWFIYTDWIIYKTTECQNHIQTIFREHLILYLERSDKMTETRDLLVKLENPC